MHIYSNTYLPIYLNFKGPHQKIIVWDDMNGLAEQVTCTVWLHRHARFGCINVHGLVQKRAQFGAEMCTVWCINVHGLVAQTCTVWLPVWLHKRARFGCTDMHGLVA